MERTEENEKMNNIIALASHRMLNLYEDWDVAGDMSYSSLQYVVRKSIKTKESLIKKLEQLDGWNPNELRVKLNIEYTLKHDIIDIWQKIEFICKNMAPCALNKEFGIYLKYSNLRDYFHETYSTEIFYDTKYFKDEAIYNINKLLGTNYSVKKTIVKIFNAIVATWKNEVQPDNYTMKEIDLALTDLGEFAKGDKVEEDTFYISVNPYDFARMSDGNNWDSCHKPTGCYCSGAISYMLDSVSMVAYMESSTDNSKLRFRKMLHLSDYAMISSRKYGFCDKEFVEALNKKLNELFIGGVELDINTYLKYFKTDKYSTHYADYCHFSEFSMCVYAKDTEEIEKAVIGHIPLCLVCWDEFTETDELICNECNDGLVCANCGERIDRNDAYEIDGDWYCGDCTAYCSECDEYFVVGDVEYYSCVNRCMCDDCAKKLLVQCDECGEWVSKDDCYITDDGKAFCEDCSENYLVVCEGCGALYHVDDCQKVGDCYYCSDCYEDLPVCAD